MRKINFVLFGSPKESYLSDAYKEYAKRLTKYAKVNFVFLDEVEVKGQLNQANIDKALDKEAEILLKNINVSKTSLILFDLHGKEMNSEDFSKAIFKLPNLDMTFVIGSSNGLSDILREKANLRVCFSKMTTTHSLALLFCLEQVYRAFKIDNNETYHK